MRKRFVSFFLVLCMFICMIPPVYATEAEESVIPEAVTPIPEVITPTPDVITPTPEVTMPTPDVITPTPDVTTPTPEVVTPTPEVTTPTPEAVTPTPDVVTPTPEVTTPTPEIITPSPEVTDDPEGEEIDDETLSLESDEIMLTAASIRKTGTWGDNITYTFYSDGLLHFTGSGPMTNHDGVPGRDDYDKRPWGTMASSVKTVVIDEGITTIGDQAFASCYYLTSVTIADSVTYIGNQAFSSCSRLPKVELPESLTKIGDYAFSGCSNITELHIPANLQSFGVLAFDGCKALRKITVDASSAYFTTDEYDVLYSKDMTTLVKYPVAHSRTSYTIPEGVTTIGDYAMGYSVNLTKITLPSTLKSIEAGGLDYCKLISTLELPNGLEKLGFSAFRGCSKLTKLMIPDSVTEFDESVFSYCSKLSEVTLSKRMTEIPDFMFYCCTALKTLRVPYGVETIGEAAVSNCTALKTIYLPVTLKTVEKGASAYSTALKTVYYDGRDEQWEAIEINNDNGGNNPLINAYRYFEFDINIYRADFLMSDHPAANSMWSNIYAKTPGQILSESGEDASLSSWSNYWDMFVALGNTLDKPTALKDYVMQPDIMYSAIILNALFQSTNDTMFDAIAETVEKDFVEPMDQICENMEMLYNLDLHDPKNFKSLTGDQKQIFISELNKYYNLDLPELKNIGEFVSWLEFGLDAAKDINEYFKYVSNCVLAYNITSSMEAVLRQAHEESKVSGNAYITKAFANCIDIVESSRENIVDLVCSEALMVSGKQGVKFLVNDVFWNEVKLTLVLTYPELGILYCAYLGGKYISELLFNADAISEKYLNMATVTQIENILLNVYEDMADTYARSGDDEDAEAYLSVIDFTYALRKDDCECAYNFVDEVSTATVSKFLNLVNADGNSYDQAKSVINGFKNTYSAEYISALTSWIYTLEDNFPGYGLYEQYYPIIERIEAKYGYTEYVIACPVDVFVYDGASNLVGYVNGNEVYAVEDMLIAKNGDTKIIRFYNSGYNIKLVGNGTGDMDVTIRNISGDGQITRTVNYYDLPLANGTTYDSNSTGYRITGHTPNYDSNNTGSKYTVTIQGGTMTQNGEICFETSASAEETIDIAAYVPKGAKFIRWESDFSEVIFDDSTAKNTTLRMPNGNIMIKAVFEGSTMGMIGDVNGDKKVNPVDALYIQKYYNGDITKDALDLTVSDVNSDTKINPVDSLYIQKYYNGDISSFT